MEIRFGDTIINDCVSIIIVPEKAIEEPGYIQAHTANNDSSSKHEFHAMAQMAYFQYQDDELDINVLADEVTLEISDQNEIFSSCLVLYRDTKGSFHALMHNGINKKKILEVAYRFCTRWVRLDI